jgi:hypothetical protein
VPCAPADVEAVHDAQRYGHDECCQHKIVVETDMSDVRQTRVYSSRSSELALIRVSVALVLTVAKRQLLIARSVLPLSPRTLAAAIHARMLFRPYRMIRRKDKRGHGRET